MLNGPLHKSGWTWWSWRPFAALMILCSHNINLWRVTKKITGQKYISGIVIHTFTPLEHNSPRLINERHQIQQQVLFWMYSGEKEKNTQLFFNHMGEYLVWFFAKALNNTVILGLMKLEALLNIQCLKAKNTQVSCLLEVKPF